MGFGLVIEIESLWHHVTLAKKKLRRLCFDSVLRVLEFSTWKISRKLNFFGDEIYWNSRQADPKWAAAMLEDAFSKNSKSLIISYLKLIHAENSGISGNFSQVLFTLCCKQKLTKLGYHYSFLNFEEKSTNTWTCLRSPRPAILM